MEDEVSRISRTFSYALEFYFRRLGIIVLFSIPFLFALLIPLLVPAPTYLGLGGVFLRVGSIPELAPTDWVLIAFAYGLAVFLMSDTLVNINIVIRSKRTLTSIGYEVVQAFKSYALRIFYITTMFMLLLFIANLVTFDNPLQSWLYPIFTLLLSGMLFFVPPAVVIDNSDTPTAIKRSVGMAVSNPHFVLIWTIVAFFSLSLVKVLGDVILSSPFSGYFTLLVNSLIVFPFLIVLQTQMYMEKYPLAR